MRNIDAISEALFEVLQDAPTAKLADLQKAIEAYKASSPLTFRNVRARQPFAAAMFDAVDEAYRYQNMELTADD